MLEAELDVIGKNVCDVSFGYGSLSDRSLLRGGVGRISGVSRALKLPLRRRSNCGPCRAQVPIG